MNQSSNEFSRKPLDDLPLPILKRDLSFVLGPTAVLRKDADPMLPSAVNVDATRPRYPRGATLGHFAYGPFAARDDLVVSGIHGDAQPPDSTVSQRQPSVAEVDA